MRISIQLSLCPTARNLQARTCLLFSRPCFLLPPQLAWLLLFLQQKKLNPLLRTKNPAQPAGPQGPPTTPSAQGTFQLKLKPPAAHVGLYSALTVLYGNPDTLSLLTSPQASA